MSSPTIAAAVEVLRALAAQLERHQHATSGACFHQARLDGAWCATHQVRAVWGCAWSCPTSGHVLADPVARPAADELVTTIDEAAGLLHATRALLGGGRG